ncbi:MAG TPA: hypothetical protein ENK83_02440 [Aliiroseovarius sp.]|nr:hypothetical protein [Aliiroseovarius sp.]
MRRSIFSFFLVLAAAGCSQFPELDQEVSARARAAQYPQILPLEGMQHDLQASGRGSGMGNLPARLARLQSRARSMRARPVVDRATRARMMAALARHS